MTEVVPPINGRRLDSRFTLLEKLGSGGQGEVWRAHDDTRGLDIALKVPANAHANNQEVLALFEREHAIASRLDHASVLKVFPPHRSGDTVVLPMELATGGDMRRMRGAGYLDIIPVLLDIAQALEHAHDCGIIHRDLKPGNVLFDARGRVKLADFGAAGTTSTTAEDARRQGLSPFTASPEQLRGEAPTEADDIYGLGALAYELLSGYPPYYPHFDLRRAQEDPVAQLIPTRQVPPGLSQLVMRMLAKNKHERPRSMREVIDELDAALNDTLAFDFESIVDPSHGAPIAAVSVTPPPLPPRVAPPAAPPAPPAQSKAGDLDEEDEDERDEEPPDLALIPDLLVANALVVTHSGKPVKPGAAQKSQATKALTGKHAVADKSARPSQAAALDETQALPQLTLAELAQQPSADETQALPPLTRQMLAALGAAAHTNAVAVSLTQELPQSPVASHVATALGHGPKVESTALDETQALPPLSLDAPGVQGAVAPLPDGAVASEDAAARARTVKADPTWANRTQVLPEESGASHTDVAAAQKSKADPVWMNKTQVLPEESGSSQAGAGVARAQTSKSDPTWANRTQALPEESAAGGASHAGAELARAKADPNRTQVLPDQPTTSPATTAAHAKLAAGRAGQADRARANALQSPQPQQTTHGRAPPSQPSESDMTWRHSGSTPSRRRDRSAESSAQRSGAAAKSSDMPHHSRPTVYSDAQRHELETANQHPARRFPTPEQQLQALHAQSALSAPAQNTTQQTTPHQKTQEGPARAAITHAPVGQREVAAQQAGHLSMHASLAAVGVGGAVGTVGPSMSTGERPLWESLQLDAVPRVARLEPMRRKRWPLVLLGTLTGIAVAVFYWLPRYAPQGLPLGVQSITQAAKNLASALPTAQSDAASDAETTSQAGSPAGASADTPAAAAAAPDGSADAKLQATRENFDRRLAALETRGAGVWGGPEFAMAKMRAAESTGARDAGNTRMAQERLADASHLLDEVESRAPQALAAELAAGEKALATGQQETANQAFELARRIDPNDRRIAEGQRHTRNMTGVLPLLADAQNAESARNYYRAAQDYSQALSLDPGNEKARAGLARANAAYGYDNYAKAVGSGFAALGAGRLDDARAAFEKARAVKPNGSEAADGLRRVAAALSAKGFTSLRQRASGLEAQERWDEAVEAYDSALKSDPSLAFAQEGKRRAAARAELGASMEALIDRPERLASAAMREQARALLQSANEQTTSGPVLRSQITRLELALPDYEKAARSDSPAAARYDSPGDAAWRSDAVPVVAKSNAYSRADMDKPVKLSLVSDNATAVAIPSIGQFGTFAKRDIELKPGRYTVIGTRDGFRDVHRDITITPGENQTISVSCSDPI